MDRERREQAKQQQKQQLQQMQRLSQMQSDNDAPQQPLFGVPKKVSCEDQSQKCRHTLIRLLHCRPLCNFAEPVIRWVIDRHHDDARDSKSLELLSVS